MLFTSVEKFRLADGRAFDCRGVDNDSSLKCKWDELALLPKGMTVDRRAPIHIVGLLALGRRFEVLKRPLSCSFRLGIVLDLLCTTIPLLD